MNIAMQHNKNFYKNFSEILLEKAKRYPNKNIIQFIHDDDRIESYTYLELHEKALSIAGELSQHYEVGARAILLFPPSPEFIFAFWGCIYAGIIPVPASLPLKNSNTIPAGLKNIIDNCDPQVCLTSTDTYKYLRLHKLHHIFKNVPLINALTQKLTLLTPLDTNFRIDKIPTILTDKIKINISHRIVDRNPNDILFLQYTSGSTDIPKGVVITHQNALQNAQAINEGFDLNDCSRLLIWMPQDHDMGLMGTTLHPIYSGYTMRFMSSAKFINDPLCWLEKIHEFRADVSGGPNFAYDLCVRYYNKKRMEKIDLSAWSRAFCGAEMIQYETLKKFADLYAQHGFNKKAFLPCYGLAESTVYVTGIKNYDIDTAITVHKQDLSNNKVTLLDENACDPALVACHPALVAGCRLVSCGIIKSEHRIKIVGKDGNTLPEKFIGKIIIQSDSVAKSYWSGHQRDNALFEFRVKDSNKNYFDTGDLGFIHNNQLYVTGRDKEILIIQGKNHYPQWIEQTIQDASHIIRKNFVAALQITEFATDKIIIALEVNDDKTNNIAMLKHLAIHIFELVDNHFNLFIERILFMPANTLAKTVSHKLARNIIAKQIAKNQLSPLFTWRDTDVNTQQMKQLKSVVV